MKKTLLGFTIVLLLMISEILILNNDISSLKASNKILQEDLKDKKNISTLKEEKEDLNTSVSNLLAVSTFSDEDIEEIMTSEKTILKDLEDNITSLENTIIDLEDKLSSLQKGTYVRKEKRNIRHREDRKKAGHRKEAKCRECDS